MPKKVHWTYDFKNWSCNDVSVENYSLSIPKFVFFTKFSFRCLLVWFFVNSKVPTSRQQHLLCYDWRWCLSLSSLCHTGYGCTLLFPTVFIPITSFWDSIHMELNEFKKKKTPGLMCVCLNSCVCSYGYYNKTVPKHTFKSRSPRILDIKNACGSNARMRYLRSNIGAAEHR